MKPMRPLEARLAALRAAKSPGCGCGHAHGATHAHGAAHADEPLMTLSRADADQRASAQSAAPAVAPATKEAA